VARKEWAEHVTTCKLRGAKCRHCGTVVREAFRSLAEHEGRCPSQKAECPNAGCSVLYQRGEMNLHRAVCEQEQVACLCPGCDGRPLRKDMGAHLLATHMSAAAELLQSAYARINAVEAAQDSEQRHVAAQDSEQRHVAPSPTSWVFNWRADGWGHGSFMSETHDFGG